MQASYIIAGIATLILAGIVLGMVSGSREGASLPISCEKGNNKGCCHYGGPSGKEVVCWPGAWVIANEKALGKTFGDGQSACKQMGATWCG